MMQSTRDILADARNSGAEVFELQTRGGAFMHVMCDIGAEQVSILVGPGVEPGGYQLMLDMGFAAGNAYIQARNESGGVSYAKHRAFNAACQTFDWYIHGNEWEVTLLD